ncbi:MAG: hypothetical protein GC160_06230 [Acidobacteria bacterium]|nr:hypothetical protein [Acidobacteriota bacterium]
MTRLVSWATVAFASLVAGPGLALLEAQEEEYANDAPRPVLTAPVATVRGRVVLPNGAPPPDQARVELRCADRLVGETYSDSQGRFRIDTDGGSNFVSAASTSEQSNTNRAAALQEAALADRYHSCEILLALHGTHGLRAPISDNIDSFGLDVGDLVVGAGMDIGAWISSTSYAAPRKARAAFVKGSADLRRQRLEPAERRLREAVGLYPAYAAAWYALGMVQSARSAFPDACASFEQAIAADAGYAPPYSPLIRGRAELGEWKEVERLAERMQSITPGAEPLFFRSLALWRQGLAEEASKAISVARKAPPSGHKPVIWLLSAEVHIASQRWPEAAQDYREFLAMEPNSPARGEIEKALDAWESGGLLKPSPAGQD